MTPIEIIAENLKVLPIVENSSIEKYMDQVMVDYMNANLNDPTRKANFLRAIERYRKLAEQTNDPMRAEYFRQRMYLPETQARIMVKEFYQKQIRSGTYSDTIQNMEGEGDYSVADSTDYGNNFADKGMFANLTGKTVHPGKTLEIDDLFTKLFSSSLLDKQDRVVLVTHLLLGTGPNLRAKSGASDSKGIDLRSIMNHPPEELKIVEDQIEKLLKFGVFESDITRDKILYGVKKDGDSGSSPQVTPLMSSKRKDIAIINIQAAMKKLIGIEDMSLIKKFMLTEALEEEDKDSIVGTISEYIGGASVSKDKIIPAIVYAVNLNLNYKTKFSKSKLFQGSKDDIIKKFIDMAGTGKDLDIMTIQDLFLAPILDQKMKN